MKTSYSTTKIALPSERILAAPDAGGLETAVGNTPLLPLRRLAKGLSPHVRIFAKAEWFNPGGSIKDRPALNILRKALADGSLENGKLPSGRRWAFRSRWHCLPMPARSALLFSRPWAQS
jgi:hypothetical protein